MYYLWSIKMNPQVYAIVNYRQSLSSNWLMQEQGKLLIICMHDVKDSYYISTNTM